MKRQAEPNPKQVTKHPNVAAPELLSLEQAINHIKSLTGQEQTSYTPVAESIKYFEDEKVQVYAREINGITYIYELSDLQHEKAVCFVIKWLQDKLPNDFYAIGRGSFNNRAPDSGLAPKDQALPGNPNAPPNSQLSNNGEPYPNLIVEVGWNETLRDLHQDAKYWLASDPYVYLVIVVKIYKARIVHGVKRRAMVIMFYDGVQSITRPIDIISFGTDYLSHIVTTYINSKESWPEVQGYVLPEHIPIQSNECTITLPRIQLYAGSVLPQPASDPVLDVFNLQEIHNVLRNLD